MRIHYLPCLLLIAAASWAQTTPVTISRNLVFSPVGVATTETIQVNVANTASNTASATASCSGTISFNVPGAKSAPAPVKFTVTSGEIFSTSSTWTSLGVSGRAEVLASVQLTQSAGTPCSLAASVETYDSSSGVTASYQANPISNGPVAVAVSAEHE